jgi:asparaginyl-tRNA synthetase
MMFQHVKEISKFDGKPVALRGWVHRKRELKDKIFLVLRQDGYIIQCIVKKDSPAWKQAEKITMESSFEMKGTVRADKRAPTGFEVDVSELKIVGLAERFPIGRDLSEDFLLDVRHLWLRSQKMTAVMKIRSVVFASIHDYFRKGEYHLIHAPILTPSACEGATDLFEVDYFGKKTYLTQSWQLYAEQFIQFLEKVYTITPAFRSEKSSTNRHLSEYWTAEVEQAWLDMDGGIKIGEELISYVCQEVAKKCKDELGVLDRDIKVLEKIKAPFPRITYDEAVELLKKDHPIKWGKDLRTIEERMLVQKHDKPLIVTHYPTAVKAFYMKLDTDPKKVKAFDILLPGSGDEVIGGSEREMDIKSVEKRLKKAGEDLASYEWYLDSRRYGAVPHSGFGLGVTRLVKWICGLDTIRDAIPFPRTMTRMKP